MDSNEFKNNIIKASKIYSFDADEMIKLLTPHNEALNWINQTKRNATTYTKFKNHLEFTNDIFSGLNNHVKNDGNKKLSKRCELLLTQLEKHRTNQSIPPKVKSYFNSLFKDDFPTPANIFSIAMSNVYYYIMQRDFNGTNYAKDIVRDIFNGVSFNTSYKYTTITIHSEDIDVVLQAKWTKEKKEFKIFK